jgi:hypothetical protein
MRTIWRKISYFKKETIQPEDLRFRVEIIEFTFDKEYFFESTEIKSEFNIFVLTARKDLQRMTFQRNNAKVHFKSQKNVVFIKLFWKHAIQQVGFICTECVDTLRRKNPSRTQAVQH